MSRDEFEEPKPGDYSLASRWRQGWGIVITAASGPLLIWLAARLASAVEPWLNSTAALAVRIVLVCLAIIGAVVFVPIWTYGTAFHYCAAGLWRKRLPDPASYFESGTGEGEGTQPPDSG